MSMSTFFTGLSSIFCGCILWYLRRYFEKRDAAEAGKDHARVENNVLLLRGVSASLQLGEATAEALVTNTCNGGMQDAREYARKVKVDIEDFARVQGSERVV